MTCGAAFKFDVETDAAIRGLWDEIAAAGLPSNMLQLNYPPHLSLLLCEDIDMIGVRRVLPEFLATQPPLPLTFPALGVFPGEEGVIYLAPTVSQAMLDFHTRLWALLEPFAIQASPLYRPGVWVPHVTLDLDINLAEAAAVIEVLSQKNRLPRQGLANGLFVADFPDDQPDLQELFVSDLGSSL